MLYFCLLGSHMLACGMTERWHVSYGLEAIDTIKYLNLNLNFVIGHLRGVSIIKHEFHKLYLNKIGNKILSSMKIIIIIVSGRLIWTQ